MTNAGTFAATMEVYYPRLVRRLTLVVRDAHEAEDLAQATLERAFKSWTTLRSEDIGAWLYTVGTRLALNEVRRRRRWRWQSLGDEDSVGHLTGDPDLWNALGNLNRQERAALVMNVLDGFSQAEIADHLGVPPGTVASWISRGKARLRSQLEDTG
jgi:RNA polymerase sigma-70 factor (ECF subfamily)